MNYLSSSSNQPISLSNRFPSISGNGRHVLYSSDAEDSWGLIFDGSNQSSADDNGLRDIYVFDRKTNATQIQIGEVEILFPKKPSNKVFISFENPTGCRFQDYTGEIRFSLWNCFCKWHTTRWGNGTTWSY